MQRCSVFVGRHWCRVSGSAAAEAQSSLRRESIDDLHILCSTTSALHRTQDESAAVRVEHAAALRAPHLLRRRHLPALRRADDILGEHQVAGSELIRRACVVLLVSSGTSQRLVCIARGAPTLGLSTARCT